MKRSTTMVILLIGLLFGLLLGTACGPTPASETATQADGDGPQIMVMDPWSRAAATAGGNGAVYLTLMNEGSSADRLLSAETEVADVVEIHETTMDENDVMRMQPIDGVEVPAGETVALEPGGKHVMLIGLKEDLQAGGTINVILNFEQAGAIPIEAEIRESGAAMEMEMEMEMDHSDQ